MTPLHETWTVWSANLLQLSTASLIDAYQIQNEPSLWDVINMNASEEDQGCPRCLTHLQVRMYDMRQILFRKIIRQLYNCRNVVAFLDWLTLYR